MTPKKKFDILYSVAKLDSGQQIKAVDAEKGQDFFCIVCKDTLILRKSGKTGKNTKRPHFAHKTLTPNCTPETALHYAFKTHAYEKVRTHLDKNEPLPMEWHCDSCTHTHSGDLLKKIQNVALEYNLSVCQPDIALLDKDDKVFAVIEVVVTHKPEEQALKYYKDNDIILIQIDLYSDKDLDQLDSKLSKPDIVDVCFNEKCTDCGHYKQMTRMKIIDGPCWKCHNTMKVAVLISGDGGMLIGLNGDGGTSLPPSDFTQEQIQFARSKGVILKKQFSKTVHDTYLANTCPQCNAFAGEFFLFTQYVSPAGYGELPFDVFDVGYRCDNCTQYQETLLSQEQIQTVWNDYANLMKGKGNEDLYSILTTQAPLLSKGELILFGVENIVQEEQIIKQERRLLQYLRFKLENKDIQLETIILNPEDIKPARIVTSVEDKEELQQDIEDINDTKKPDVNREVYEQMVKKNPHLQKLQEQLDLDIGD